ncbi:MAG: carbohydrate porin [Terracidiphilus sp.]
MARRSHRLIQLAARISCVLTLCLAAPRFSVAQASFPAQEPSAKAAADTAASQSTTPQAPVSNAGQPNSESSSPSDSVTLFPHSGKARYWISGQTNIVLQWHPSFYAQYSGTNSLTNWEQSATTHVLTLYTGYELTRTTEVFADLEDATGSGIGNANGLAGYTNLDSVRIADGVALSRSPYLARFMLREVIPLTGEREDADRDEFHLANSLPARRIEFRLGKFDLADFFDLNTWGSDSHLQFLNWTVDNNGAYDYAANTRGYTNGAVLEYDDHWWTLRFAEALMPKTANGQFLDADIARARAENLELEARGKRIAHRQGTVRLLSYLNHANMGNYEDAIRAFLNGETTNPDIIATRQQGRHRYGFGLNFEQEITPDVGVFGRLGWSDGRNESFAYTEDDRTIQLGTFASGKVWHRRNDRAGAAFVANGIVAAHQQYLALGGLGFVLGDGALTYGHEKIVESFYTAHLWRGFFISYDFQHINDPGYNQARGPVAVSSFRFHTEF